MPTKEADPLQNGWDPRDRPERRWTEAAFRAVLALTQYRQTH
jgi:hypothetical protein